MKTSALFTALAMIGIVSAGSHDAMRRRPHGRVARYPPLSRTVVEQQETRGCVEGAWQSAGSADASSASVAAPSAAAANFTSSAVAEGSTIAANESASTFLPPARATGSGDFSAPHYVIYADNWLSQLPSASAISSYNRFILAFWMSSSGAVDNAQAWAGFDASYRQQVLDEYHNAGIALMVSAFGSTDAPTSAGADPTQTAQQLASWVKEYGLDGVDIDYEDMGAMDGGSAEAWLITFQQELRRQLPAPYLISHAPVAPWFTSGPNYPAGGYVNVHKQVGSGIDFYNIQFYNQGTGVYGDCSSLINDSGSAWPDTSVAQINSHAGVPLNKIVIGKPLQAADASNGYVDPSTLGSCVGQAKSLGWNGGVMFWQYTSNANSVMATVRA